jgi:hypothetical protein
MSLGGVIRLSDRIGSPTAQFAALESSTLRTSIASKVYLLQLHRGWFEDPPSPGRAPRGLWAPLNAIDSIDMAIGE